MSHEKQTLLASPAKPAAHGPSKFLGDVLWSPKAMYTISNMGVSAYVNYLAVFYENTAQYSKIQIGVLQALPCICTILGPPFWCAIADKYQIHRKIHVASIVAGALLIYSISFTRSFPVTLATLLLANFLMSPSGALLDHAVLDMISKYGGEYGKQRLFGAVGYGAGAYLAGLAVAAGGIAWAFNSSLIFLFTSLVILRQIPVPSTHDDEPEPGHVEDGKHNRPLERKASFSEAMRALARKTDVLVLMGVVFLIGLMYGVLSSFLTLNLYELSGQNPQIIGVAIMCETSSELPAFFFSQKLIDKLGTVKVMLVSISAYAIRITYYAFMTNAWSAIPFEFLHGLTFGLTWAAVTQYLYKAAPRGSEGTMMGLLNAVLNGAGRGGGTLIGGFFFEHYGARTMWLVTDLGVPLALLGLAWFSYLKTQQESLAAAKPESEVVQLAHVLSPRAATPLALVSPKQPTAAPTYDAV